jgi:hypothetical protein
MYQLRCKRIETIRRPPYQQENHPELKPAFETLIRSSCFLKSEILAAVSQIHFCSCFEQSMGSRELTNVLLTAGLSLSFPGVAARCKAVTIS